jgi:multicomponent Na+:H+ antiporter subunit A
LGRPAGRLTGAVVVALLVLHAVLGLAGLAFASRLGRNGLLLGIFGPLITVVWLLFQLPKVLDDEPVEQSVTWLPALGINLDLRLDGFGALMVTLVAGIGVAIYAYALSYFPRHREGLGRLVALLTLFAGSMFGLVVADNLLVLYGFWELTSITSFLLIGNNHHDGRSRAAALQALLITSMGALAMLVGFIVLGQAAGTYRLSALIADPPSGTAVNVALVLVLVGAFTKSAQYPTHGWLPAAMVAPTPVSAYLHSATMVKAGVYLIARLSPAFAEVSFWRPVIVFVGLYTMIAAGLRALRQTDLKLLLAMGTVSQLGFMIAVLGLGSPESAIAGCVVLLAHGLYKAAAFMVVGILDHQHGSRDTRVIPRADRSWGLTTAVTVITAASMAGVPLLFGFVAKESEFEALVDQTGIGSVVAVIAALVGSILTVAYSLRFAMGALGFLSGRGSALTADVSYGAPKWWFVAPGLVLSAVTVVAGLVPSVLDDFIGAAAADLDQAVHDVHLAIWHGFTRPLFLSVVALVVGAALYAARQLVDPVLQAAQPSPVSSSLAYRWTLRGLNSLANRVAGIVQSGSLPVYLGVILLTAAAIPGTLLVSDTWWPGMPEFAETPLHVPIAAVIVGAGLAAAAVRRRFTAALFLGVTGYSMAGLFVIQGAPDLALTQVAIESLTTVLFVLVLRRLPDRFESQTPLWRRTIRIGIAATVGLTVFAFAITAGSQDPPTPVSDSMVELAEPEGHGRNVVNVILVDFRGFDTLGEITVMTAAAIGTVALARAGRRPSTAGVPDRAGEGRNAVPPPVAVTRLVTLEVSMRLLFTVVMVGSLYLLFVGHNQPGGGFAGGIVAGAAVALRYISGGIAEVRRLSRGQPWLVLGSGVLISSLTALLPLLFGGSVLETYFWTLDLPLVGDVKLTSALAFDIGVYLVVVGLVLMMFESFGDDPPPVEESVDQLPEPLERSLA